MAAFGPGLAIAQDNINQSFNFEGVEAFWDVVSVLETDTEPAEEQWDAFFTAPGYKRLTGEFGRTSFMASRCPCRIQ